MGFKTFVNGDILDASEVNDFLMKQSVMVFADAAARTTALPSPIEGMVTYLQDADELFLYDGANWVVVNDNSASIPKSIVTTKADIIVATGDATPVRFGVGTNGQVLTADSGETEGIKWDTPVDTGVSVLNEQTSTTYTLVLADKGKLVTLTNAASITLTVPLNSSVAFPTGTRIDLLAGGAGVVTVEPAVGVTINSKDSNLDLTGEWSAATLIKLDTDEWVLVGDLA